MTPESNEVIYSDIAVNREDFVSEVYSIILKIKPGWKLENLNYKVNCIRKFVYLYPVVIAQNGKKLYFIAV